MNSIRVAIVDDHPLFRVGLASSLRRSPEIDVVGIGATADEAVEIACRDNIDVLLLDLEIPGSGIEAARRLSKQKPGLRILILTGSSSEDNVAKALAAGAAGYVLKGETGREIINAIQMIHRGQPYVTPELASRILTERDRQESQYSPNARAAWRRSELSARERQILDLAAQGLKNKEIADAVEISPATVKYHMTQIVRKWGVRNRVEAIAVHSKAGGGEVAHAAAAEGV
jgi:two-component system, NarL family, nitrate/nitrite response regulator NarL